MSDNAPTGPTRRYKMTLVLGADDWQELCNALDQIHTDFILRREPITANYNGVSGGPASGWTIDIRVDDTMTHERYFEELNAYIERLRHKESAEDAPDV